MAKWKAEGKKGKKYKQRWRKKTKTREKKKEDCVYKVGDKSGYQYHFQSLNGETK